MSRIDVLNESLSKKEALLDEKLTEHFNDVKSANGQPLNDKRNGRATTDRWERQSDSLRRMQEGIEKTKAAIEREEMKIAGVELVRAELPKPILDAIEAGIITQWRRHPETFFVPGVDRARIVWLKKKNTIGTRYASSVTDPEQWRKFAKTFNALRKEMVSTNA